MTRSPRAIAANPPIDLIADNRPALPTGWKWARLGDVCEPRTGTRDPGQSPEQPFLYVDISSVDNKRKRITEAKRIFGKDAPSRARQIIKTDDVLVATTRPNLNAVAMVSSEFNDQIASTGFCVLRASSGILPEFLFAFVQAPSFVETLSDLVKGALYPAVTDKQVRDQCIPLPPLAEQKRIAAILKAKLAAVERARAATQTQLDAANALPSAYFREIFSSTEAQAWPKRKIADFAETSSGSTPSRGNESYYTNGIIPWVKTGELLDNELTQTEERVTDTALAECSIKLLPPGTVLIAMYGQGQTRGRTTILTMPATTNQACFAIVANDSFDSKYLQYWFRHSYMRLRAETEGRGGNQSNLNGELLRRQELPLPSLPIQRQVAADLKEKLAGVETLRSSLEAQLAKLKALPAAYLRQAFAGEL